ncbi:MAG TPA: SCO family protein [Vicinamibacterales bacterium]|nr:SCO family protein [Vicinamibacterales bacterium]
MSGRLLALALALLAPAAPARAQWIRQQPLPPGPPAVVREVGIAQRLNTPVPADLSFRDEHGRAVRLADLLGRRPVILTLVYYECPLLCGQVLEGLSKALRVVPFEPGRDYEVVAVSFDARETPASAAARKRALAARDGRVDRWHLLTGEAPAVERLAEAVGFRFTYDEGSGQFAHAAAAMVLTPEGVLARYFYGVEYAPRDLKFALMEASDRRIGSLADELLLLCYRYDPAQGRYGAIAYRLIRIGGGLTVAALGAFIVVMLRRERRARREASAAGEP